MDVELIVLSDGKEVIKEPNWADEHRFERTAGVRVTPGWFTGEGETLTC
jgi:hypothetical protein